MMKRINSKEQMPIEYDIGQLQYLVGTGVDIVVNRGNQKIHSYRCGVETPIGDIEVSLWYQLVNEYAEAHGEKELLELKYKSYYEDCYIDKLSHRSEHARRCAYSEYVKERSINESCININ